MRTRIKPLEFTRDDRPTGRPWFVVLSAALLLTALVLTPLVEAQEPHSYSRSLSDTVPPPPRDS